MQWEPTNKSTRLRQEDDFPQDLGTKPTKMSALNLNLLIRPMLFHAILLFGLVVQQLVSTMTLSIALAWLPLAVQSLAVLTVVLAYGFSHLDKSTLPLDAFTAKGLQPSDTYI